MTRGSGDRPTSGREGRDTTESAYYLAGHRAKRSLTLDFTKPAGAISPAADRLLRRPDRELQGSARSAKYGLGHAELRAEFPRLGLLLDHGLRPDRPYAPRAGYDY